MKPDPKPKSAQESPEEVTLSGIIRKHRKRREDAHSDSGAGPQPHKKSGSTTPALLLLKVFPWILTAGFAFSFFWDFDGFGFTIGGTVFALDGLLRIITISGLIGFATNWLAVQMLFYPREKRPLLRQGLIPAQKEKIALKLSEAIERELINPELIIKEFTEKGILKKYTDAAIADMRKLSENQEFKDDVNRLLGTYVKRALNDPAVNRQIISQAEKAILANVKNSPVERNALKLYLLMKGKTLEDLLRDAVSAFPAHLEQAQDAVDSFIASLPARLRKDRGYVEQVLITLLNTVTEQIQIRSIIQQRISGYDEEKLERIIRGTTDDHLNYIKYLGAVIGTIGGLVIWNPASLLVLAALTIVIWLTDRVMG